MRKVLTSARRHWRLRSATALAAAGALVMSGGLVLVATSTSAVAEGQDHVFVCKYVGTPKVDEVLKSGKQPIYVAVSSIQHNQWDGVTVPAYFSDAQDRSYVLDWATEANTGQGNTYIGDKVCPGPDNPHGNLIDLPEVSVNDPCGPTNATWVVPANDSTFTWQLVDGHLIVTIIKDNTFFRGHKTSYDYGIAQDSGEPCYIAPPGAPRTTDPCDVGNIYFNVPADAEQLDYTLLSNGDVTVQPVAPYVFTGTTQLITFPLPADSGVLCPDIPPPPPPPPAALDELAPDVVFTDATCDTLGEESWDGTLEAFLDYEAIGEVGPGETISVEAMIEPAYADEYEFAEGAETEFTHTFAGVTLEDCVQGEETVIPKPDKPEPKPDHKPTVKGVEVVAPPAAVPTSVAAGVVDATAVSSGQLLGQALAGIGLMMLVAVGWRAAVPRAPGAHES